MIAAGCMPLPDQSGTEAKPVVCSKASYSAAGQEIAAKEATPGSRKKDLDIEIVDEQVDSDQHIGSALLWPEVIGDRSGWEEGSADCSHLDVVCHLYLYDAMTVGALLVTSQHDDADSS